eukprot:s1120_g7.t2
MGAIRKCSHFKWLSLSDGWLPVPRRHDGTRGDRADESCEGLEDSCATVEAFIQEQKSGGIPAEKIVVAGFSQGGALSLFTGLSRPYRLGGVVCMSGYLPFARTFVPSPDASSTPVLHCHGSADQVVRLSWAHAGRKRLEEVGISLDWRVYEDMGHSACDEELDDVASWIADRIA